MANGYEPGDYLAQFLSPTNIARMYTAKQNAQLQRERFEYYKGKDADAAAEVKRKEAYNQNVRAWTQMQNFAQEMPFGQQANFLRKQLDTLPQDFIESQNLDKFIDNYGIIEDNEVDQRGIFDNVMDEDNPNKIRFSVDYLEDPRRKKQALSQAKKLESQYGKQKQFDVNKLTATEQRDYKTISGLLSEQEGLLLESTLPGALQNEAMTVQANNAKAGIQMLQKRLEPLLQKGAPIVMPEFNYSPESLKALTDDPDLMASFLAAPEDDMDAYYNAYKTPEPPSVPIDETAPAVESQVVQKSGGQTGSMWEPTKTTINVQGPGGVTTPKIVTGGFQLKTDAPSEYQGQQGEQRRQKEEAALSKQIKDYENEIAKADKQIALIDKAMQTLSGNNLETAKKQREVFIRRKTKASEGLAAAQPKYDFIKKPTR